MADLGIFFLTWMVFTMFFVLVPNRRVPFRDAVVGAFLSAVLFDVAKLGFVAYVSNANYSVIYGALATIPIFLFWLHLNWTILLFGAELAFAIQNRDTYAEEQAAAENLTKIGGSYPGFMLYVPINFRRY